jgi:hypothetical protein
LGHTGLDLGQGGGDDTSVNLPDLFIHSTVLITGVVDKHHSHDTIEIIWVLVIDGNACIVLERLTDPTLEKIFIEIGKEKSIQWSLTLLKRIKV